MKYLSILLILLLIGGNIVSATNIDTSNKNTILSTDQSNNEEISKYNINNNVFLNIKRKRSKIDNESDYEEQLYYQLKDKYKSFIEKNFECIKYVLYDYDIYTDFIKYIEQKEQLNNYYFHNKYYYFDWIMKNYIIDHVMWLLKKQAEKNNVEYKDKSDDEIEKFFMENTDLVNNLTNKFTKEFYKDLKKWQSEIKPLDFFNTVN